LFVNIAQVMISEKTVAAAVEENSKNISSNVAVVAAEEITEAVVPAAVITVAAAAAGNLKSGIDLYRNKLFERLIRNVLANLFYFPVLCGIQTLSVIHLNI
jgi:hypothetical protein